MQVCDQATTRAILGITPPGTFRHLCPAIAVASATALKTDCQVRRIATAGGSIPIRRDVTKLLDSSHLNVSTGKKNARHIFRTTTSVGGDVGCDQTHRLNRGGNPGARRERRLNSSSDATRATYKTDDFRGDRLQADRF